MTTLTLSIDDLPPLRRAALRLLAMVSNLTNMPQEFMAIQRAACVVCREMAYAGSTPKFIWFCEDGVLLRIAHDPNADPPITIGPVNDIIIDDA